MSQEAEAPPVGHNHPPEPTPLELMTQAIDDLYMEAENWLDGEAIATEEQAAEVTKLKGRLQAAIKTADVERKKIADPIYKEWKDTNAAWMPLTNKADKALKVAQRALTPWLQMVEAEQRRKADEARRIAEDAADALRRQAIAERQSSDLADVDHREALEEDAKATARLARQADKEAPVVRTEVGKATLRTYWLCEVEDYGALLAHYRRVDPQWLKDALRERAEKDVRGGARYLDGCRITSEQRAI